jgi:hypothetical protein
VVVWVVLPPPPYNPAFDDDLEEATMLKVKWVTPLLLAAALLAAGCGEDSADSSEGGATTGGSTAATDDGSDRAVQYSECMRENGVPEFPDPENGRLMLRAGPDSGIDPNSAEFKAAQEACQDLAPQGGQAGGAPNPELQEQVLEYAKCMRENGVPNFPDPDVSGGAVRMSPGEGVDPNSPQFQQAQQACQDKLSGLGGAP